MKPRVGIDYVWDGGLIRRVRKSDLPHIKGVMPMAKYPKPKKPKMPKHPMPKKGC